MESIWKPLGIVMLAFYVQWFLPSRPGGRVVGVDFGEPTRHCAGRGQICRIDLLETFDEVKPEAPGELWMDSTGQLFLSFPEVFWDEAGDTDSLRQWLLLPEPLSLPDRRGAERTRETLAAPGAKRGRRDKGQIAFPLMLQNP